MNNDVELFDRITRFVQEQVGVSLDDIHLDSRLSDDFGMAGDDAIEFFDKFVEEFHVDRKSVTFDFEKHFGSEGFGCGCIPAIVVLGCWCGFAEQHGYAEVVILSVAFFAAIAIYWLCGVIYRRIFGEVIANPITINDLFEAAKAGRWVANK